MRVRGLPLVVGSALVAGAGLVLAGLRRRWVHVTVDGPSMLPALSPGDRLLARRSPAAAVRTGDIVLARGPAGQAWLSPGRPSDRVMIKRAVAVPGDQVPPGVVAERGVELHGTVPEGLFVLLGDNPDDSVDSRMLGYCPGTSIIGVVPRRAGPARSPVPAGRIRGGPPGPRSRT